MEEKKDKYLAELDERIEVLKSQIEYKPNTAAYFLTFSIFAISIGFSFFGKELLVWLNITNNPIYDNTSLIGIAFTFYLGCLIAILSARNSQIKQRKREELISLEAQKRTIRPLSDEVTPTYFDRLVDINVNNLSDYYKLVKQHTDKSFLASISAGAIGFALIITGLLIGFSDFENSKSVAYISAGSGVIIEFISGVFFYLYNKTTIQLKGYHDSLVNIQNVLLSFKVIEDTDDSTAKLTMAKSMIEALIGGKSA